MSSAPDYENTRRLFLRIIIRNVNWDSWAKTTSVRTNETTTYKFVLETRCGLILNRLQITNLHNLLNSKRVPSILILSSTNRRWWSIKCEYMHHVNNSKYDMKFSIVYCARPFTSWISKQRAALLCFQFSLKWTLFLIYS